MSDESFLARWSRLKRERARPSSLGESVEPASDPAPAAPAIDVASLPPVESLGSGSDISAFLSPGVPPDLTQTALRRAWRADASVRDFVEIADNQWDFNEPEAMPGFGALGAAEQATNLVMQALESMSDGPSNAPPGADVGVPSSAVTKAISSDDSRFVDPVWQAGASTARNHEGASECPEPETVIDENRSGEEAPAPNRRPHGSALPK